MDDLEYQILLSGNYHRKRESFFEGLDVSSKIVSLMAISSIVAAPIPLWLSWAFAAISVVFTILSVSCDFAGRATRHRVLAERFSHLRKRIHEGSPESQIRIELLDIQSQEPPVVTAVAQICQDEIDYAQGCEVTMKRLNFWRRVVAPFGFGVYSSMSQAIHKKP